MKKPKLHKKEYLDYREMIKYIEKKYNINTRNYAGKKFTGEPDDPPYQDYWHWLIEGWEGSNGSFIHIPIIIDDELCEMPDFVKEITKLIAAEFGEYADGEETLEAWVEW